MNIYIFVGCEKASNSYHEGGSVAIVAKDIDEVKSLVKAKGGEILLSDMDIQAAIVYPLKGKHEPKVFAFPDAGCC